VDTTGAAESRIAVESFAASAPLPESVSTREGPDPGAITVVHRRISSVGTSVPSRSRTELRARFRSWPTAPLLVLSRDAISS
jgi:hypothetical protein